MMNVCKNALAGMKHISSKALERRRELTRLGTRSEAMFVDFELDMTEWKRKSTTTMALPHLKGG